MSSETDTKGGKDMKAEGRDSKTGMDSKCATDSKGAADSKSGTAQTDSKPGATTGNAATSATAAPPAEKRSQITSAIKSETSIRETTNVNFNISVGTRAFRARSPSTRFRRGSSRSIRNGAAIRSSWSKAATSSCARRRMRSSTSSKANGFRVDGYWGWADDARPFCVSDRSSSTLVNERFP